MRNFILGLLIGAGIAIGSSVAAQNRVLPQYLIYGRTSMGINEPVLVDSSGIVQVKTN